MDNFCYIMELHDHHCLFHICWINFNNKLPKKYEAEMDVFPVKQKILWLLSGISLTNCTVVVISYWLLLSRFDRPLKINLESYLLIDRHSINLLLLVIQFCLNRFPVQTFHLYILWILEFCMKCLM